MINSNFGFTPLKEIWLGDCYPESYYDHLPNSVADPLRQITEWTKEDTKQLQTFLESRGITVRRPVFDSVDNYINDQGHLIKPPVTPRDDYIVLNQSLYSLHCRLEYDPWKHWIEHYQNCGYDVYSPKDQPINCLAPPAIVRVGKDLILDQDSHRSMWGFVCEWMVENCKEYRISVSSTSGHSDGVFCPVAPGIIVSSHYKADYSQSFPEWEVYKIPSNLHNFKSSGRGWWLHGDKFSDNQDFIRHISTDAQSWVGNFAETVYEVNMLVLDEKNVVAMKEYPPLTKWLEERGITMHFFDLRTRSFWDGGWHCFTLDIHRDDTKSDLFPNRGDNGLTWRLN